jgi:hypothetical protein
VLRWQTVAPTVASVTASTVLRWLPALHSHCTVVSDSNHVPYASFLYSGHTAGTLCIKRTLLPSGSSQFSHNHSTLARIKQGQRQAVALVV